MLRKNLGRQDAETEVFLDKIIEKEGGCNDNVLLIILSEINDDEEKAQRLVTYSLLHRSANPSAIGEEGVTPLHLAVKNNFKSVCTKLLDHGAKVDAENKNMPYTLALENRNDDIAAMLIRKMKKETVRNLYSRVKKNENPKFSFHDLLEKEEMSETVLAVLDCMKEPIGEGEKVRVYYNVLEADREGHVPSDGENIDSESKTGFQFIAQKGDKTIVNHDVVRLLIMRKWEKYARSRFLFKALLNLITLVTITFSAIVASTAQDPTLYNNSALQIARAVFEMWSLGMTFYKLLHEIQQLRKLRLQYFKYASNWVDTTSCLLILLLPPLRFTHKNEQWFVFSAAYLFWTARMFQYATVFRKSGAYVLILRRIIKHDILQFTIFFAFILLAFSGCLLLSLRGEGSLEKFSESSTYWSILFVGIRILIEAKRILEYTEFQTISVIIMVGFLFTICIVLLNILIAQVSDTFQDVQQDAQREYEVTRASIVTRMEQNSLCFCKVIFSL
ncbi:uncharacterized protein LOC128185454 [Crassostrea angulata]|uniref:uncharacterized protein LOC128185454 n=1 Tax=Magallana angulata TaxID=2784310 RepID=UPI0022B18451|nr:uncharacterized protein LOC128185454 [Crassostrea angulata]